MFCICLHFTRKKKSVQVLWCSDLIESTAYYQKFGSLQKFSASLHMYHAPCTTNQIHYSKLSGLHFCSDSLLAISSTFSCKAEGHPCLSGVCSESKWFFLKAVFLYMCDDLEKKVCAIQPFLLTEHCVIRKALVGKLPQFLHTSFCFRISAV